MRVCPEFTNVVAARFHLSELCGGRTNEAMEWKAIGRLMQAAWWGAHAFGASGQIPFWQGDTTQWHCTATAATLDAQEAGSAGIRRCLDPPTGSGLDLRWRWEQHLAGSSANRSALTAYALEPDSTAWLTLELGAVGADDPLEATHWQNGVAGSTSLVPGQFAQGLDAEFRWLVLPDAAQGMLYIRPDGEPFFSPLLVVEGMPRCLSLSAEFTASHTQDFRLEVVPECTFEPDTLAPFIMQAQVLADGRCRVQFSEVLGGTPVGFWPGEVGALCAMESPGCLECLPPPTGLPAGLPVPLRLEGVQDTSGNAVEGLAAMALWLPDDLARPGDLAFTEIMADPTPSAGLPETEWVEITNFSTTHQHVDHLILREGSTPSPMVPLPPWDGVLEPGGRFVASSDTTRIAPSVRQAHAPLCGALTDSGERLSLLRSDGLTLDDLTYARSWWQGVGGGHSVALQQRGACGIASHWGPSSPASPGTGNEASQPEALPLRVQAFRPLNPGQGAIAFNQPIAPQALGTLSWRHPPQAIPLVPTSDAVATWSGAVPRSGPYVLSGLRTCDAPWDSLPPLIVLDSLAAFPEPGDLTTTEIAVRPPPSWPGMPAFVEWTNRSTQAIEAAGVRVNGVSTSVRRVEPGGSVVVPIDLPNTEGRITLTDADGRVLESFRYTNCWHAQRNEEDEGMSLERRDLNGPVSDGRNWETCQQGCTPGWFEAGPDWEDDEPPALQAIVEREEGVVRWFSEPVVALEGAMEVDVEDWGSGAESSRAWWWPDAAVPFAVEDAAGNRSDFDGASPLYSEGTWRLNECFGWVGSADEPFLETVAVGEGWARSDGMHWSTDDAPGPSDWVALGTVQWAVPAGQPVAWARCPQRHSGGIVLPTELPSLHGDRRVSLANWSGMEWHIVDTLWSARERFDPLDRLMEGTSWERFHPDPGAWAPSIWGPTPGRTNGRTARDPAGTNDLRIAPQTCIPFDATWGQIRIESHRPVDEFRIFDSSGTCIRRTETASSTGSVTTWFWDGTRGDGLPAAPGPHWVVALSEGQIWGRHPIAVAPQRD